MAATIIDTLKVVFGADTSGIENGMSKVQNVLQGGLRNIMTNFVAPLASAFTTTKLFGEYTSKADAIGKMSAAFDIDGEKLQAWGEAAARAGGSAEGLQNSVRSLNMGIQQFVKTGKGRSAAFLEMLGLKQGDLKNADGSLKDTFEMMQMLADKSESMDKAEFVGIASRLGIDQGTIMLLQSGRKAVDELVARQKSLGVYTKKDFQITADFNDAMADLGQVFKSVSAIIMRTLTPVVTKIAGWLTDGLAFLRQHEPFVKGLFVGFAALMTMKMLPAIKVVTSAFLSSGKAILLSPWGAIAALVAGIVIAIDDLYAYLDGGESAFADFWASFGTVERLNEVFATIGESFGRVFDGIAELAAKIKPILGNLFSIIGDGAMVAVRGIAALTEKIIDISNTAAPYADKIFGGIADGLQIMADTFNSAGGGLDGILAVTKRVLGALGSLIIDGLSFVWEAVKKRFRTAGDNLAAYARELWTRITAPVKDMIAAVKIRFNELLADIGGVLDSIGGSFARTFDSIAAIAGGVVNWLAEAFSGAVSFIGDIFSSLAGIFSGVGDTLTGIWEGICNFFADAWDGVIQWISDKLFGFIQSAKDAWKSVKSFFGFGDDEGATVTVNQKEPKPQTANGTPQGNTQPVRVEVKNDTPRAAPIDARRAPQERERINYITPPRPNADRPAQAVPEGNIKVLPPVYQPAQAVAPSKVENRNDIRNDTQINISSINVETQATDAQGVAGGIGTAMSNEFKARDFVVTGNTGVVK